MKPLSNGGTTRNLGSLIYRYGMLALLLILTIHVVRTVLNLPADFSGERYSIGIVALALLFNHIAFSFEWRRSVARVFEIAAFGWLIFALAYILTR
jgi:hypothetical protein